MDVGRQTMTNAQLGIRTTGHNIANRSTDGYSRQRVEYLSNQPIGYGGLQVGTGARAAAIRSIRNDYLEKQIEGETQKKGYATASADGMMRVEQVFNEQMSRGLNRFVSDFFNSFRELANSPENSATRTLVKDNAVAMAKDFKRVYGQLRSVQEDLDNQLKAEVAEINSMTEEIAKLNERVATIENQGMPSNDERDRRNLLIKKLAEKVDIKYAENESGIVNVMMGHNAILVSGFSTANLKTAQRGEESGYRAGNLDVIYDPPGDAAGFVMTDKIKSGSLGGAIEVRDVVVHELLNKLDDLAYTIASDVNKEHISGMDRYQKPGILFFDLIEDKKNAGEKLSINTSIQENVGKIATSYAGNGPGDNRLANKIASLQFDLKMEEGIGSYDDFYNSMVGEVAILAKKNNMYMDHQTKMLGQLESVRESISGVSIDEETTKMLELQRNFDASARLIRTADEMLQTVLTLKD